MAFLYSKKNTLSHAYFLFCLILVHHYYLVKCRQFYRFFTFHLSKTVHICLDQAHWKSLGEEELERALNKKIIEGAAKNVILFIGDGMGPTTVTSSRIYGKGESGHLAWEKFNNIGVIKVF